MSRRRRKTKRQLEQEKFLAERGWKRHGDGNWSHRRLAFRWCLQDAVRLEEEDKTATLAERKDPWADVRSVSVAELLRKSQEVIDQPTRKMGRAA